MDGQVPLDGRAQTSGSTFRMEHAVGIAIAAPANKVWKLLTDAAGFPRWNSTVTSLEGEIRAGGKLKVRVPNVGRTFGLTVRRFEPPREMVWASGAMPIFSGVRTFTVFALPDGGSGFRMVELFRGLMLPLIKGSLPDFGPMFETYAADLKREAEKR
jgi:uncharacterized protein YndB with AHSA1/START domain